MSGGPGQKGAWPAVLKDDFEHHLWAFQRDGVAFGLQKNGRCLIGDEVGGWVGGSVLRGHARVSRGEEQAQGARGKLQRAAGGDSSGAV
jgi:hypothetical protein